MEMESTVVYTGGLSFDAELDGHHFNIDADEKFGGQNKGPKPKGLLLTSLIGCTAMDVMSILQKMRVEPTLFKVVAGANLAETHPKVFTQVVLDYYFEGEDLSESKLLKAVALSRDRYCGVSAMLVKVEGLDMRGRVWLNGKTILDETEA